MLWLLFLRTSCNLRSVHNLFIAGTEHQWCTRRSKCRLAAVSGFLYFLTPLCIIIIDFWTWYCVKMRCICLKPWSPFLRFYKVSASLSGSHDLFTRPVQSYKSWVTGNGDSVTDQIYERNQTASCPLEWLLYTAASSCLLSNYTEHLNQQSECRWKWTVELQMAATMSSNFFIQLQESLLSPLCCVFNCFSEAIQRLSYETRWFLNCNTDGRVLLLKNKTLVGIKVQSASGSGRIFRTIIKPGHVKTFL